MKLSKTRQESFTTNFVWYFIREKYHLDLTLEL